MMVRVILFFLGGGMFIMCKAMASKDTVFNSL